jgi:hypothetical protein
MNGTPIQASEASADIITAWSKQYNTYDNRPRSIKAAVLSVLGPVSLLVFPPLAIVALWLIHR